MSSHSVGSRYLLVIGPGPLSERAIRRAVRELGNGRSGAHRLDVLPFRDGEEGGPVPRVRTLWQGEVAELNGAEYLASVDDYVRNRISQFVARLREQLVSIARSTGGERWATRFGSLWWKTQVSEKNSPADPAWWQLFRAAAVRLRLREQGYSRCVVVGDDYFVRLVQQVAENEGVRCSAFPQRVERFKLHRLILARGLACLYLLLAIAMAKRHHHQRGRRAPRKGQGGHSGPTVMYSWFPRVWTDRFGGWKDMYYGGLSEHLAEQSGTQPILALRMYDRVQFVTPLTYLRRLRLLGQPGRRPNSYVLVESFGKLWETARFYLNPLDALRYLRMTRHPSFHGAFEWEGLNTRSLFEKGIWRSILLSWPHLLALDNNAARLARHLKPSMIVLYSFEFVFGRAIIQGSRQGAPDTPILGVQHGPMPPMHLLYAGASAERGDSPSGGAPLPEPDAYAVDGRQAARILEGKGIPRESITVTGPARFDDVWLEARRVRTLTKTNGGRTRILVAPSGHDTSFVFGLVLRTLSQDSRLELVLRPHPRVSDEHVSREMGDARYDGQPGGAVVKVIREGSIYELMAGSEIFLGTYSSTMAEALVFGLPVVLLLPSETPDMSTFHGQSPSLLKTSTAAELREHVERLMTDDTFRAEYVSRVSSILEDVFGPIESKSSLRLARLCQELAAQPVAPRKVTKTG